MQNQSNSVRWLLTLTLLNTVILCASGLPSLLTDPIPHSFLASGFYAIAYISQNFLFAGMLGIVLLPLFLTNLSDRLKIILAIIPVGLALFFTFMNAKVYAFWRLHVNGTLLRMYFSKGGGSQVFEVCDTMYWWIFLVASAFLITTILTVVLARALRNHTYLKKNYLLLVAIYGIAQMSFITLSVQDNMRIAQYATKVPYFYDLSWARFIHQKAKTISNELKITLNQPSALHYPLHSLRYHFPAQPLNVLLIVVDTLRYDMINPTNMPNVYRFAQHADWFLDNLSGGDCTKPGIFSLFYGIPATYWSQAKRHSQGSIVIRAFQANHYHLGLFASAPLLSPKFDKTVFATVKHFQTITPGKTPIDRDIKITEQMENFLNKQTVTHHPFFGFLFYDAPHAYNALTLTHPFKPIGYLNYFSIDNETSPKPFYNLYQNAVLVDDALIEKIFHALKKDNLMKNTVVIITADHGQEYNENKNNYWEHASDFSKYQVRTPLIMAWPNRAPKMIYAQTTHYDLAPTLLKRVLGVSNPVGDYSVGDDFFSKKQPLFTLAGNYSYFALITENKIMLFHASGLYRFTDRKMNALPNQTVPSSDFAAALQEMQRYD
ncbi:MAG: hypothetical protein A3C44_05450 [Gammaproteobacteria bacterium RIFCSPHIGHO2_02_FULL_39_13]|nr:MAG: hypothetical protein A3C44_05450 [Gammaproteobacteria bacterium RIFCSPHIGHO2_02_FULL_39_13]OGT50477.1 MAG: hypothetical protein A3E53_06695 [Gammaproteobacteria bacterium RIFCSPHIGHO2_12_FULL_39_24]